MSALHGQDIHVLASAVKGVLTIDLEPPFISAFHYEVFIKAASTFSPAGSAPRAMMA